MSLYEMIKDMHIFDEFTEDEKKQVAKMNHSVFEYHQGDHITQEGDSSTALYLIVKGTVLVTKTRDDAKILLGSPSLEAKHGPTPVVLGRRYKTDEKWRGTRCRILRPFCDWHHRTRERLSRFPFVQSIPRQISVS